MGGLAEAFGLGETLQSPEGRMSQRESFRADPMRAVVIDGFFEPGFANALLGIPDGLIAPPAERRSDSKRTENNPRRIIRII